MTHPVPDPHTTETPLAPAASADLAPLEQSDLAPGYVAAEEADADELRRSDAAWTARLIYLCFAVLEIALGIRVLLKLIAANPNSGFTRFIYGLTAAFVAPFNNIVSLPQASNGSTLDLSALLAMLIYLLVSWITVRFFLLWRDRPPRRPASADSSH